MASVHEHSVNAESVFSRSAGGGIPKMNPASAIGVDRRDALSSAVPAKADTGALSLSLFLLFLYISPCVSVRH